MKEKIVETKLQVGEIEEIKKLSDGTWVIKQKVAVEVTPEKFNSMCEIERLFFQSERTVETNLPVGRIVEIKELPDGTWVINQKVVVEKEAKKSNSMWEIEHLFVQIEAESLSMDDEFMKYEPRTKREKRTKELIAEGIKSRVKNFYRPILDPAFDIDGIDEIYIYWWCMRRCVDPLFAEGIVYGGWKKPAGGQSCRWWVDAAKKYAPSRNSRLGTRLEYGAFLGVLIKKLIEKGKSVEWAWNAVCNDSKELGHYRDSYDARPEFESTGSRCICGFYDLANTEKILAEDEEAGGFWIAGGRYLDWGGGCPLAHLELTTGRRCHEGVGWLVIS